MVFLIPIYNTNIWNCRLYNPGNDFYDLGVHTSKFINLNFTKETQWASACDRSLRTYISWSFNYFSRVTSCYFYFNPTFQMLSNSTRRLISSSPSLSGFRLYSYSMYSIHNGVLTSVPSLFPSSSIALFSSSSSNTTTTTPPVQFHGKNTLNENQIRKIGEVDTLMRQAYDNVPEQYPLHAQPDDPITGKIDQPIDKHIAFRKRLLYRSKQRGW